MAYRPNEGITYPPTRGVQRDEIRHAQAAKRRPRDRRENAGRPHLAEEMAAASATFGCSPPCSHTVLDPRGPPPGMEIEAVVELGSELHFLLQ